MKFCGLCYVGADKMATRDPSGIKYCKIAFVIICPGSEMLVGSDKFIMPLVNCPSQEFGGITQTHSFVFECQLNLQYYLQQRICPALAAKTWPVVVYKTKKEDRLEKPSPKERKNDKGREKAKE